MCVTIRTRDGRWLCGRQRYWGRCRCQQGRWRTLLGFTQSRKQRGQVEIELAITTGNYKNGPEKMSKICHPSGMDREIKIQSFFTSKLKNFHFFFSNSVVENVFLSLESLQRLNMLIPFRGPASTESYFGVTSFSKSDWNVASLAHQVPGLGARWFKKDLHLRTAAFDIFL